MSGLDRTESLVVTMSHAVRLSQIAVDGLDAMVGFASDLIGTLTVNTPFATNNAFVGHTTAGIVDRPTLGDDCIVLTFVLRQQFPNERIGNVQYFR